MNTPRVNPRSLTPLVCALLLAIVIATPLVAQSEDDQHSETVSTSQDTERERDAHESEAEAGEDQAAKEARETKDRSVTPKEASQKNVSPLVEAAKSSKKKKSGVRSFTDADLSPTKGKLIVVQGTNVREPEIIPVEERSPEVIQSLRGTPPPEEKMNAVQRQKAEKALEEQISALETELRQLETEYYMIEEEDHREVVERTFDEKRKALTDAKERLSKLRGGGS